MSGFETESNAFLMSQEDMKRVCSFDRASSMLLVILSIAVLVPRWGPKCCDGESDWCLRHTFWMRLRMIRSHTFRRFSRSARGLSSLMVGYGFVVFGLRHTRRLVQDEGTCFVSQSSVSLSKTAC